MENVTTRLVKDHNNILKLTQVMEYMVNNQTQDMDDFQTIAYLIKNFADDYHHIKEEKIIFPLLKKNAENQDVMIQNMLTEHATGRNMNESLIRAINTFNKDCNSYNDIYENMKSFVIHIRAHIEFENKTLYPYFETQISEKEKQDLICLFDKVDSSQFCGSIISDCTTTIHKLCNKYKLQPAYN